jgi:hypothetical protein
MGHRLIGAALMTATAVSAGAQDLPATSRSPLGEAIRAALIASPELLSGLTAAPRPEIDLYADDISRDLALLDRAAPDLFDSDRAGIGPAGAPVRIAFFTRADCATCAAARAELATLATRMGFRATVIDMDRDAALVRDLGLDMAPSYVLRDRMLRGAMPAIVLDRYLSE